MEHPNGNNKDGQNSGLKIMVNFGRWSTCEVLLYLGKLR